MPDGVTDGMMFDLCRDVEFMAFAEKERRPFPLRPEPTILGLSVEDILL